MSKKMVVITELVINGVKATEESCQRIVSYKKPSVDKPWWEFLFDDKSFIVATGFVSFSDESQCEGPNPLVES